MVINIYLGSFDTTHEWGGQWFEIHSIDDLREAVSICSYHGVEEIEVCDFEGDFEYSTLGGSLMLGFLYDHFDILEEISATIDSRLLRDYFLRTYSIEEVLEAYHSASIDTIPRDASVSDNYLIGEYFAGMIDFQDLPKVCQMYFDYEAYGRDILLDGSYTFLESDGAIFLIS